MVKEMRKIILSRDEVMTALESYKRNNFEFLPAGKIVQCDLKHGAPVAVGIETATANKIKTTEFHLDHTKLLEPLIRFCIENNIVLPRNSKKSALIGDDQAALYIQIGTNGEM
jgi:hypothetical protein